MLIAGDPSGDQLGAELARELLTRTQPFAPRLFGAGGPAMAAAGVELAHDLTQHSVIGLEIFAQYRALRRAFHDLVALARSELPDLVVGIDYGGFNLRFARTIHALAARGAGAFHNWRPRLAQFVSPQVWASRPGRANQMEQTHDLLLSILPFEAKWYAENAPKLRVEFVGHPLVDRHQPSAECGMRNAESTPVTRHLSPVTPQPATLLLLPGSRPAELLRHLPVMVPAARRAAQETGAALELVVPNAHLRAIAEAFTAGLPALKLQVGDLPGALRRATVALASTGTVTLECAWFGVPTVALYKTSRLTYEIGRRIVTVKHLAVPNLLAGEAVMPEFVQDAATESALAEAVTLLLRDGARRAAIRSKLAPLAKSLGEPGACRRAADALMALLPE